MTKFILVSGGVISGIGKGVIGNEASHEKSVLFPNFTPIFSVVDWITPEDRRAESHCYQDRSVHEH
jgi:hypothetical protein